MSRFLSLLIFLTVIYCTVAIVCRPNMCDTVRCRNDVVCADGQILKKGGFCQCCNACHTILHEGDPCDSLTLIKLGGPPPLEECDSNAGLACIDNKCRKLTNLNESS